MPHFTVQKQSCVECYDANRAFRKSTDGGFGRSPTGKEGESMFRVRVWLSEWDQVVVT